MDIILYVVSNNEVKESWFIGHASAKDYFVMGNHTAANFENLADLYIQELDYRNETGYVDSLFSHDNRKYIEILIKKYPKATFQIRYEKLK
jgi:hypothetical protein